MSEITYTKGPPIVAPDHVWGMHDHAVRKHRKAYTAWRRTFHVTRREDGKCWCHSGNARKAKRGRMWEYRILHWHEALQVITPYIHAAYFLDPKP